MARIVGRGRGILDLQSVMGNEGVRNILNQTVTGQEADQMKEQEEKAKEKKDSSEENKSTGRTKTTPRSGSDKSKSNDEVSKSDVDQSEASWEAVEKGMPINPFLMGMAAGATNDGFFGSGRSEVGSEWGVNPISLSEIYDSPGTFRELYDQNVGASPHLTESDIRGFGNQVFFNRLTGNNMNDLDWLAGAANNAQTPGGSFMTMGDIWGAIRSDNQVADEFRSMDPGTVNNMMLGAVAQNYPGPIMNAVQSMLNGAENEYNAAVATGYKGTYIDFLDENGYSSQLEGM